MFLSDDGFGMSRMRRKRKSHNEKKSSLNDKSIDHVLAYFLTTSRDRNSSHGVVDDPSMKHISSNCSRIGDGSALTRVTCKVRGADVVVGSGHGRSGNRNSRGCAALICSCWIIRSKVATSCSGDFLRYIVTG